MSTPANHFTSPGSQAANEQPPHTAGRIIHWATRYDLAVKVLALGHDRSIRQQTVELAQIKPGDKVLDVGCGTGDLTQAAKAQAGSTGDVYGIDASPEMIEVAWRKAARAGVDIHYRVDLIEALSFPDDTFDVVLSSLMIHHLPDELKRKGLAEICRVLKPNGCLIVVDMNRPTTLLGKVMMHVSSHGDKPIGLQDLPSLMHKTGFVQIETGRMLLGMLGFARGRTPT